MSECQCAAEDIYQDDGHDLPDDESIMETHTPCADGNTYNRSHTELV